MSQLPKLDVVLARNGLNRFCRFRGSGVVRKSIDDLEPTEDEILEEIAMKQSAEENEDESDD